MTFKYPPACAIRRAEEAVARLKPKFRDILLMHRFDDLGYGEIATAKGMSASIATRSALTCLMTKSRATPRVNRIDLKMIEPEDPSLELMYFGLKGMTREADDVLAEHGFGRAHHRILFVIARHDRISVGRLRDSLGISAQAMHRPLKQLQDKCFVAVSRDPKQHRVKSLHLTEAGRTLEHRASEAERRVMRSAFDKFGKDAAASWANIMQAIAARA